MDYDNYIKMPIVLLTYQEGYCYANNSYLSDKLNLGIRAITRLLKEFSNNKYIRMEFKHKFIRKIFIVNEINTSISLNFKD